MQQALRLSVLSSELADTKPNSVAHSARATINAIIKTIGIKHVEVTRRC